MAFAQSVHGSTINSVRELRDLARDPSVRTTRLVVDASTPREDISMSGRFTRHENPDGSTGGFVHESSRVDQSAHIGKTVIIGYDSRVPEGVRLEGDEFRAVIRRGTVRQMSGYE